MIQRLHMMIGGTVQGVGFRPFVFRLARQLSLTGWVRNNSAGVEIEIEGGNPGLEHFMAAVHREKPALAQISNVLVKPLPPLYSRDFTIRPSALSSANSAVPSPDIAICRDCQNEIADKNDRRYRHAFANCTNCGPRYTIIKTLPYDRTATTMADFPMCKDCQSEYHNPLNRRFHAQPTACPSCGPQYRLLDNSGQPYAAAGDIWLQARELIKKGKIIALKGLGGYQLACDAYNEAAVDLLRQRKHRKDKPFAVMAGSIKALKSLCEISPAELTLLYGPAAPIVLLTKKAGYRLADSVAPENPLLGAMLPYTPAHCLLLDPADVFVMTSGNNGNCPIIYLDEDALSGLRCIADYFLVHNRPVYRRADDSVARIVAGQPYLLRRSRGFTPRPLSFSKPLPPVLACGGELKSTFCLSSDYNAYLSGHIGDLKNLPTYQHYTESIEDFKRLLMIEPQLIAHDLHPEYLSTKYAHEQKLPRIAVQHHHAHIAAVMAEHHLSQPVIGVAFDGLGLGDDSALWGGEFLITSFTHYRRAAHCAYLPLPGGDKAVSQPWRMGLAILNRLFGENLSKVGLPSVAAWPDEWPFLVQMLSGAAHCPLTSSAGRLFDAAAAILNLRSVNHYEGQAAMALEWLAGRTAGRILPYTIQDSTVRILDFLPAYHRMVQMIRKDQPSSFIAASFHDTIADGITQMVKLINRDTGLTKVVLSGGVFQNIRLLTTVVTLLKQTKLTPYIPCAVPPNDAGIALGQSLIASARHNRGMADAAL